MSKPAILLLLQLSFLCGFINADDDLDASKKIKLKDNTELKPLKPFIDECCADIEMDIVPSTERKSGHLNQEFQKNISEIPKLNNRLHEGRLENGFNLVEKSPESKSRNSNPELHIFDTVPRYHQTQRMVENDEGKIVDRVQGDTRVFIRKIKVADLTRIPTTQRINGEGKFGDGLGFLVPAVANPLKEGKVEKGYNWVIANTDLHRMFPNVDFFLNIAPRESQNSNRNRVETDLDLVPRFGEGFLDCR